MGFTGVYFSRTCFPDDKDFDRLYLFQHDAQLDYYGTKLATCSSDRSIKVFDVKGGQQRLISDLRGLVRTQCLYWRIVEPPLGKANNVVSEQV